MGPVPAAFIGVPEEHTFTPVHLLPFIPISPPRHLLPIGVVCPAPQVLCTNYNLNQF